MDEDQSFAFRGNAVLNFRLRIRSNSLSVSTTKKKGGEVAKTWDVSFAGIQTIRISERVGARTRVSAVYLKPRDGEMAMFCWQKNALGASDADKKIYYDAAMAALQAIAEQRPDLKATFGPDRPSALIGAGLGAIFFIGATYLGIGEINTIFWIAAALISAVYAYSAARSGVFKPTRTLTLLEARNELAANAAR
ncbi:MAG: hypothetical protein ABL889_07460 [Terricaulis sp.]